MPIVIEFDRTSVEDRAIFMIGDKNYSNTINTFVLSIH